MNQSSKFRSKSITIKQNESKVLELERNTQQINQNPIIDKDESKNNTPSKVDEKVHKDNIENEKLNTQKKANKELILKNNRIKEFKEKI